MSEYNIVRFDLGKQYPDDTEDTIDIPGAGLQELFESWDFKRMKLGASIYITRNLPSNGEEYNEKVSYPFEARGI